GKTRIEQQRFPRRRNKQGRCPAFDIDPIDFQVARLRCSSHRENESKESKGAFHASYLYKDGNRHKKIQPSRLSPGRLCTIKREPDHKRHKNGPKKHK